MPLMKRIKDSLNEESMVNLEEVVTFFTKI
jgi:hypothetical protein